MNAQILHADDYLGRGQWLHVARAQYQHQSGTNVHTHADFAEVFWIERGHGFHLVNGQRLPLEPGDLVLVRRRDAHGFATAPGSQLDFVNVAFRDGVLAEMRQRYFAGALWPWRGDTVPKQVRLSPGVRERLSHWADTLTAAAQSRLELEGFLIDLLRVLADRRGRLHGAPLPPWIDDGLNRLLASGDLADAVQSLSRLTGRSREHINRTVRACSGRTTTDLLNDLRIEEAARRLRMTSASIMDVALDCGLSNVAHFYRLFAVRMGTTPRRYRIRERAILP